MGALLAKALLIAAISVGPGPWPCGQEPGVTVRDGCAVPPNQIYVPTVWWSDTAGGEVPFAPADILNMRNHELGHVVDYNFLTDPDRGMFKALMRDRRVGWRLAANSPHERFAEAFRLCATSVRYVSRYMADGGGYGYRPTLYQHRKVCRWMTGLARHS